MKLKELITEASLYISQLDKVSSINILDETIKVKDMKEESVYGDKNVIITFEDNKFGLTRVRLKSDGYNTDSCSIAYIHVFDDQFSGLKKARSISIKQDFFKKSLEASLEKGIKGLSFFDEKMEALNKSA